MAKKNRHTYPDVPAQLAHPVVDNHTHLPVGTDHGALGDTRDYSHRPATEIPPTIDEHLARMDAAGIRAAITCGCEVPDLAESVELAVRYPGRIYTAIAIHPNEAPLHCGITEKGPDGLEHGTDPWHREYSLEEAVGLVADLAQCEGVVAIGESGLDYFRTAETGKEAQIEAFRLHIALAKELDLPLQIHDREAHEDCVKVLRAEGAPERTVFHCFSGDEDLARVCVENGWYGSFGGTLTYKANEVLRKAFRAFPDELVLLETDAPYLTPMPWRGHPNAPYAAAYTARFGAELRGLTEEQWCERLDTNTREVYEI